MPQKEHNEGHRKALLIRENLDAWGAGDPRKKVQFLCGGFVGCGGGEVRMVDDGGKRHNINNNEPIST